MKLIDFPGRNVIFAENQPEYLPLPAYRMEGSPHGTIICCWHLNWRDRLRVLFRGRVWHTILTFNAPLQPQLLETVKPHYVPDESPEALRQRAELHARAAAEAKQEEPWYL